MLIVLRDISARAISARAVFRARVVPGPALFRMRTITTPIDAPRINAPATPPAIRPPFLFGDSRGSTSERIVVVVGAVVIAVGVVTVLVELVGRVTVTVVDVGVVVVGGVAAAIKIPVAQVF